MTIHDFPRKTEAVVRFIDGLWTLIESVDVGEMTTAEAIGALEIVKYQLITQLSELPMRA